VPTHSIRPAYFRRCPSGDTQMPDVPGADSPYPCGMPAPARL